MKVNKINAFTIGETMVVMLIIGALAIILLSSATKTMPDKNKMYFKKAYSVAERTIGELVNDEFLYPYDRMKVGFINTNKVRIPGTSLDVEGKAKLCALFMSKMNTIGGFPVSIDEDSASEMCTFDTTDGVRWVIPEITNTTTFPATIVVDVNGEEEPNSHDGDNQDQFNIRFTSDGKVYVDKDSKEAEFLKSSEVRKEYK